MSAPGEELGKLRRYSRCQTIKKTNYEHANGQNKSIFLGLYGLRYALITANTSILSFHGNPVLCDHSPSTVKWIPFIHFPPDPPFLTHSQNLSAMRHSLFVGRHVGRQAAGCQQSESCFQGCKTMKVMENSLQCPLTYSTLRKYSYPYSYPFFVF